MYPSTKQPAIIEEVLKVEPNKEEIKIRLVFKVSFQNKDTAKNAKLLWNANLKYWYFDIKFMNIAEAREFINDDEKAFNFPSNIIFDFKIMKFDDDNDFEGDEYEKLFQKYYKFQNLHIQSKNEKNLKKEISQKKVWGFACDYCKELKLSESEIKEMRRNYIFNKKPCNECSMGHKLSYLI